MGFVFIAVLSTIGAKDINKKGYWIGEDAEEWHITDWNLARAIVDFLKNEKAATIVDFGCGMGEYVKTFNECGFKGAGYDGNPMTSKND